MVLRYFIKNGRQWYTDIPGYLDRHPGRDADLYVDDYYSHKLFDFVIRRDSKQSMVRLETTEFNGYHLKLEKYGTGEFDRPLNQSEYQFRGVCYKITSSASDFSGSSHSELSGFDKIWLCEALKDLFNGQHPDLLYMRNLCNGDENTLNPTDREKFLEFLSTNTSADKKNNPGCSTKSIIIMVVAAVVIALLKSCLFG